MSSNDLGTCELFVSNLRLSDLLDDAQVDGVVRDFVVACPGANSEEFAQHFVTLGILTHFQAEALLRKESPDLVVGPYVLLDVLGVGRMGTVYKGRSRADNRHYAVKILPRRDVWNLIRVRKQLPVFGRLHHPGVVPFVDAGTARGLHYLVWTFVEGESLDRVVGRQGKVEPRLAASYSLQAAEALEVCHRSGIVHGLIQPSNLILGPDQRVRLLDLGVSLLLAEGESAVHTLGKASEVASQLNCASPETLQDWTALTPPSDQYSLGCVLYFLLTGRYPFDGKTLGDKIRGHQSGQYPSLRQANPVIPPALGAVVERLLRKDPQSRYESMAEVADRLRSISTSPSSRLVPRLALGPAEGFEPAGPPRATPPAPPETPPETPPEVPAPRAPEARGEPGRPTLTALVFAAVAALAWVLATVLRLY
jgi:serine/threonine-protein kinase